MITPSLQQHDLILKRRLADLIRPDGGLYFSDMCFPKEKHADTGLSDVAADGVWQLSMQFSLI